MSRPVSRPLARTPIPAPTHLVRVGIALTLVAALLAFAVRAQAQRSIAPAITLRPLVGALVGTGAQRQMLQSAVLVGAQASYVVHPNAALVGTLGWSSSRDKPALQQPRLDLYQYDVGIEGRFNDLTDGAPVVTRPFAAFGAGGRTYLPRAVPNAEARSNPLLYAAAGVDLEHAEGRFGLRLEARDNVSWFKGFRAELPKIEARNDLQFSAGLTIAL
jgi:hypothetical protein